MSSFPIGNTYNPPFNGVDGSLVNTYSTNVGGIAFSNTTVPTGPHTSCPTANNVQSAMGIYPASQKGGKINRKKINKISRKYKMKGSKRTIKRRIRRIKGRVRSKYRHHSSKSRSFRSRSFRRHQKGGSAPIYPAGHSQYLNNNGSVSNTYSLGGPLSASNSALANPPPQQLVANASIPDNLNHNALNAYGNSGAGSGFPSRGSF